MKNHDLEPIPIPARQRWHDARLRVAPAAVFGVALLVVAFLWNAHVAAPTLVGQAEPVLSNLTSHKPGMVAVLNVVRFQKVKAGEELCQVIVADPKVVASQLALIRAELDMLRANMQPLVQQQRNAVDYAQLRVDWMRERASLAGAKVNLQLAGAECQRTEALFQSKLVSQSELDIARANRDALRQQVEELATLVADGETNFTNMRPPGAADISQISNEPMQAAIAVQESKLRLTEAELSPVTLHAPMDGIVTSVHHRDGESVVAGEPIVAISSLAPVRIVGYLRAPNLDAAKVGMKVQVRTRDARRETGLARITEVGTQLETPPLALASPYKFATDMVLPIEISLPGNLTFHPGELVDVTLMSKAD